MPTIETRIALLEQTQYRQDREGIEMNRQMQMLTTQLELTIQTVQGLRSDLNGTKSMGWKILLGFGGMVTILVESIGWIWDHIMARH